VQGTDAIGEKPAELPCPKCKETMRTGTVHRQQQLQQGEGDEEALAQQSVRAEAGAGGALPASARQATPAPAIAPAAPAPAPAPARVPQPPQQQQLEPQRQSSQPQSQPPSLAEATMALQEADPSKKLSMAAALSKLNASGLLGSKMRSFINYFLSAKLLDDERAFHFQVIREHLQEGDVAYVKGWIEDTVAFAY
jgi:hypothetical protein